MNIKKRQRAPFFRFVKGQTLYFVETDFGITVTKMVVLEIINNHEYVWTDSWGEEDSEYRIGPAIRFKIDDRERIIPCEDFDLNSFMCTSGRDALRIVKTFSTDVSGFNLETNYYFYTHRT